MLTITPAEISAAYDDGAVIRITRPVMGEPHTFTARLISTDGQSRAYFTTDGEWYDTAEDGEWSHADIDTAIAHVREERAAILAEAEAEGLAETFRYRSFSSAARMRDHLTALRAARDYAPAVGDGMTAVYPQDRYPYVITRVSPSGKTVWVKPLQTVDLSTGHAPARYVGEWPVWDHAYTEEERAAYVIEDAPETRVNRSRDGLSWTAQGVGYQAGIARLLRNYSH